DSVIMRLVCREEISTVLKGGAEFVYTPDLNNVYRLLELCRESGFDVPQYEDFILDMSHKLRHGTSKCIAVEYKGEYAACAMTVAQSASSAVIGAVAVKREYRRLGFGSLCVSELCRMLGNREIFIVRLKDRNKEFYEQLGFI
ncbi:MAG: GNAT family N-acetyltransferase, partial [Clostridia bacterium]|nr:GNAT family N-acetyltransferase [Clostridia bacterium]